MPDDFTRRRTFLDNRKATESNGQKLSRLNRPAKTLMQEGATPTQAPAVPPPPPSGAPSDQNSSTPGNSAAFGTHSSPAAAGLPGSAGKPPRSGLHRPKQCATPELAAAAQQKAGERMFAASQEKQRRAAARAAAPPEGCTFKPKTTQSRKGAGVNGDTTKGQARIDRMYAAEVKRRNELKRRQELPGEGCTFKPALSPGVARLKSGGGGNGARGQARVDRMYNEHMKKQAAMKARQEEASTAGCTFKPTITKAAIAKGASRRSSMARNPAAAFAENEKKRAALFKRNEDAALEREMEGCTFAPQLHGSTSNKSAGASPGNSSSGGGSPGASPAGSSTSAFAERQAAYAAQRRAKIADLRAARKEEEMLGHTFKVRVLLPAGLLSWRSPADSLICLPASLHLLHHTAHADSVARPRYELLSGERGGRGRW